MFKRPIIRPRPRHSAPAPYLSDQELQCVSGLAADIIRRARNMRIPSAPQLQWSPPNEYEFVAKNTSDPAAFIARCEAWFDAHPRHVRQQVAPPPVIDQAPVLALFAKYARLPGGPKPPPLRELVVAWRAAGYPEERIAKAVERRNRLDETADERQRALDAIFAKFPSASKPAAKPKSKKVIKVVKKKMPQNNNEQT
jgi:hypothetical protein